MFIHTRNKMLYVTDIFLKFLLLIHLLNQKKKSFYLYLPSTIVIYSIHFFVTFDITWLKQKYNWIFAVFLSSHKLCSVNFRSYYFAIVFCENWVIFWSFCFSYFYHININFCAYSSGLESQSNCTIFYTIINHNNHFI